MFSGLVCSEAGNTPYPKILGKGLLEVALLGLMRADQEGQKITIWIWLTWGGEGGQALCTQCLLLGPKDLSCPATNAACLEGRPPQF